MKIRFKIVLLFILIYGREKLHSQSIVGLYKKLPVKITELNIQQKNSLFQNKEYTLPYADSTETIVYGIEELDTVNNYLRIYQKYTTGQAGWERFEFRLFKSKFRKLLIVSKIGGVRVSNQQNEFIIFELNKDNSLKRIETSWSIDNLEFFEGATRDFLTANEDEFCFHYELDPAQFPNGIAFTANPCYIIDDRIAKIQKKDIIRLNWNGQNFEKESN